MITNQNQWKNCDQVSCPASTGKEKWMKLTGPVTFIQTLNFFSLGFDSLFNTIDLESLESKENSDTVPEVLNTTRSYVLR